MNLSCGEATKVLDSVDDCKPYYLVTGPNRGGEPWYNIDSVSVNILCHTTCFQNLGGYILIYVLIIVGKTGTLAQQVRIVPFG